MLWNNFNFLFVALLKFSTLLDEIIWVFELNQWFDYYLYCYRNYDNDNADIVVLFYSYCLKV